MWNNSNSGMRRQQHAIRTTHTHTLDWGKIQHKSVGRVQNANADDKLQHIARRMRVQQKKRKIEKKNEKQK